MSAKIDKIVLKIGKQSIELSPEEAKELASILHELYGKKHAGFFPIPYPIPQPYPSPIPAPVWPRPWKYYEWKPGWTTDSTDGTVPTGTLTFTNTSP